MRKFLRKGKDILSKRKRILSEVVMLMMKSIAQDVAPYRIRVNSVAPDAIRIPINTAT